MRTILTFLLLTSAAFSQLIIGLKPDKDQFVAHEAVTLTLSITNRAGKTITLQGHDRKNWLDFNLYNQEGNLLPYKGAAPTFKAVKIAAGQTVQKKIEISDFYNLTRFGNFKAQALVKLPNSNSAISSKNVLFLITNGRTLFSQKIGLPNTGSARKYEVIQFNGSKTTEIYVKTTNEYTGRVTSCEALSAIQTFRDPKAALDKHNHLHLLYLITPTLYIHHVVAPTGSVIKRNYHKQGAYGSPRLESFSNGEVKVAGTIPVDPNKAKKAASEQRKASDRPKVTF